MVEYHRQTGVGSERMSPSEFILIDIVEQAFNNAGKCKLLVLSGLAPLLKATGILMVPLESAAWRIVRRILRPKEKSLEAAS